MSNATLPPLRPRTALIGSHSSADPRSERINVMALSSITEDTNETEISTTPAIENRPTRPMMTTDTRHEAVVLGGSLIELWKRYYIMQERMSELHDIVATLACDVRSLHSTVDMLSYQLEDPVSF